MSTFNNKIITNSSQEVFWNIHNKRPVLKSHFNKVLGLQSAALSKKRPRHRCFPVKLLRTRFLSNTSGRLLLEELKISLKTVPIAIPNDISKAYYEKGFSCSWTFAPSWALPKGVFRGGQKGIKSRLSNVSEMLCFHCCSLNTQMKKRNFEAHFGLLIT